MIDFQNIFVAFCLLVNLVFAIDITENRIDRDVLLAKVGDTTIHPGAYWALLNTASTSIVGDLQVKSNAGFFITSPSQSLDFIVTLSSSHNLINNAGVIAFDGRSTPKATIYNLLGQSFSNSGEFYFASSGAKHSPSSINAKDWTNTGLIVFSQSQRNTGLLTLGSHSKTITNDGQICIDNQIYEQTSSIYGSGCITAVKKSTIYIPHTKLSVQSSHSFYLKDSQASIIIHKDAKPDQPYNVYGFGNGNKIGTTFPISGHSSYSYDATTGILTLSKLLKSQSFRIGTGYDPSLFDIVTDDTPGIPNSSNGAVTYWGPVPFRTIPGLCNIPCDDVPD
ncbi:putative Hyr1-like cell wall protein, partial [Candida maltosa Xu316]